jgi:hypothetical protein
MVRRVGSGEWGVESGEWGVESGESKYAAACGLAVFNKKQIANCKLQIANCKFKKTTLTTYDLIPNP